MATASPPWWRQRRTALKSLAPLLVLCFLLAAVPCARAADAASQPQTQVLLHAMYTQSNNFASGIGMGLLDSGITVNVTWNGPLSTLLATSNYSSDDLIIAAVALPDATVRTYLDDDANFGTVHYTYIIPNSGGSLRLQDWSPNTYFTGTEPATEMLGLLVHALRQVDPVKLGFMYLDSPTSLGAAVYTEFLARVTALGRESDIVTYTSETVTTDSQAYVTFSSAVGGTRSAIFVFGPDNANTAAFLTKVLTDSSLTPYIFVPSWLMRSTVSLYASIASGSSASSLKDKSQVFMSSTNPHPQDTRWAAMAQYLRDIDANSSPNTSLNVPSAVEAVAGWIAGAVAKQSLQASVAWPSTSGGRLTNGTLLSQDDYQEWLFAYRSYTIGGDIFIGPYAGECDSSCSYPRTFTKCNIGGRMVLVHQLASFVDNVDGTSYLGLETITDADMLLQPRECRAADVHLNMSRLVQIGVLNYIVANNTVARYMHTQVLSGVMPNVPVNFMWRRPTLRGTTAANVSSAVRQQPVAALVGVIPTALTDSTLLLVDPVFLASALYQAQSNVIYLCPTAEQQWTVLAAMLAEKSSYGDVALAMRKTTSASASDFIVTASPIMSAAALTVTSNMELGDGFGTAKLPTSGVLFLAGLVSTDLSDMATYLTDNPELYIVVLFDELTALYNSFASSFGSLDSGVTSRLLFVTNIPHWLSSNSETDLTKSFLSAVTDSSYHTPTALRAYIAARVLRQLSRDVPLPTSDALEAAFYRAQIIAVDDLQLGPYQYTDCDYNMSAGGMICSSFHNTIATYLYVWSYQRIVDPNAATVGGPYVVKQLGSPAIAIPTTTTSTTTTTTTTSTSTTTSTTMPASTTTQAPQAARGGSDTTTIVAVAVVCGVVAVLAVMAALLWFCCRGDSRDNRNAPKDAALPVTLVFTDIESSTALWATAPQAMAAAMVLHHRTIRELIVRYGCYEVKTIGDSFMIACRDTFAAVQLARDVQLRLLEADWGSTAIDDTYAALGKGGLSSGPWKGLRVRIGVHCGITEVRFDEVTKGYDYYGDTVNTASRTESASLGGQVLCTATVVDSLALEQREAVDLVEAGSYRLHGVPEPMEMFELCCVANRAFPARVTAPGTLAELADSSSPADALVEASEQESWQPPSNLAEVTEVLDVYFSAYSTPQKIRMLRQTCKYFSLPRPKRSLFASDEAYLQLLIQSVALRTSTVIDFKHRMQGVAELGTEPEMGTEYMSPASVSRAENDYAVASTLGRSRGPRRSLVLGTSLHDNGESAVVLVLNNGELLTLRGGADDAAKDKARQPLHRDPLTSRREDPSAEAPRYLNGAPTVPGDASSCFEEGNGLLFRVIDTASNRWAYYNDTTDFVMHVHFSIGATSRVRWGPAVAGRVQLVKASQSYEGELLVQPRATEVLLTGNVHGYGMRYSASIARDESD